MAFIVRPVRLAFTRAWHRAVLLTTNDDVDEPTHAGVAAIRIITTTNITHAIPQSANDFRSRTRSIIMIVFAYKLQYIMR